MPNATEKVLMVLNALCMSQSEPTALSKISDVTGLNKSTVSHILKILCQHNYASRVSHTAGYLPGAELYYLTRYGKFESGLIERCRPAMQDLHDRYGCTVGLSVINNGQKYIIDRISGDFVHNDPDAYIIKDRLLSISGRVILSRMPTNEVLELFHKGALSALSESTAELFEKLNLIKNKEVCFMSEVYGDKVFSSFAFPVMNKGVCAASVGICFVRPCNNNDIVGEYRKEIMANVVSASRLVNI